jgi:hypothetical protein
MRANQIMEDLRLSAKNRGDHLRFSPI